MRARIWQARLWLNAHPEVEGAMLGALVSLIVIVPYILFVLQFWG